MKGSIKGNVGNTGFESMPLDASTLAQMIIEYDHHEIHAGSMFHAFDSSVNLGSETGDHLQLLFTTADSAKLAHLLVSGYGAGAYYITLREAPTGGGTGGTALTILNRRRGSSNTPSVITAITKDASAATGGTLIHEAYVGAGNRDGGEVRGSHEWILKPNTLYALRIYDTSAIAAWITMDWYEHTDKY